MRPVDEMPQIWSPEVAQAIAQHMSMPGLEDRQHQYVRYAGQMEARKVEDGWLMSESEAAYERVYGATGGPGFNTNNCLPQQVQLNITSAPAEFCLPMKNDRQFKPHFQVQVRVVHSGSLHLPLRLKAFAIVQDDKNQITDWLPDELREQSSERRSRMIVDLKGSTVVSYVFQSTTTSSGQPSISQIPQMPSANGRVTTAEAVPCFPSRIARPTDARPLQQSDSIRSQDDDPDIATPLNLGSVCNTVVAQYEFKYLEFARPTRMNPVYMVFACLVADQDLLFVLYDVPCISICRAEQRAKALERLGMPNTVYKEIEERGGGHVVAPVPARNTATNDDGTHGGDSSAGQDMGGIWAAIARQTSQAKGLLDPQGGQGLIANGDAAGGDLNNDSSIPLMHVPQSFLDMDLPLRSLTPEDELATAKLNDDLAKQSTAALGGTGGSSLQGLMSNPSLSQFISNLAKDSSFADIAGLGFNSGIPDANGLSLGGGPPGTSDFTTAPIPGNPAVSDSMRVKRGFPDDFSNAPAPHHHGRNGQVNMADITDSGPEPMNNMTTAAMLNNAAPAPLPGRHVRPATDATRAQTTVPENGAVQGGAAGFEAQWMARQAAEPPSGGGGAQVPMDDSGVTQMDAYSWIIDEYASTGLQRQLTRQDYQALLSLAGFPVIAGLDLHARVDPRQFNEFQRQFRAALQMLRSISSLWNRQEPCIVSGFDMDRRRAISALAAQPVGTFICRFSMNQPGCLVLSCKVRPETGGAEEGDLLHLTVSMADLQNRRIEQVIMSLPYASHVLDVYTNRRVDKRTQLVSGYMRVHRVYDAVQATETTSNDVRAASSVSRSVS